MRSLALLILSMTNSAMAISENSSFCQAGIRSPHEHHGLYFCCAGSCGSCGEREHECAGLPGGAEHCCVGQILLSDNECSRPEETGCIMLPSASLSAAISEKTEEKKEGKEKKEAAVEVKMRWIHIEKCGQTFATTVYLWGCGAKSRMAQEAINFLVTSTSGTKVLNASKKWKAENCRMSAYNNHTGHYEHRHVIAPVGGHKPFDANRDWGHVALMVREPSARYESHRNYFGQAPSLGHMTMMLTGEENVTMADAERAADMLKSREATMFVGLVEEWNLSIVLFHCLFMPDVKPQVAEMANLHPTAEAKKLKYIGNETAPFDDKDSVVYAAAVDRFFQDVRSNRAVVISNARKWNINISLVEP